MDNRQNVFQRYAYSPRYKYDNVDNINTSNEGNRMVVFSGGDMQAYINNIKVGNLESVTWSISVEVVGNYVMGRRDAVIYTTGKRVVVGSMVMSQYDRHALLEQVFRVSDMGKHPSIATLWSQGPLAKQSGQSGDQTDSRISGLSPVNINWQNVSEDNPTYGSADLLKGLSREAFEQELQAMEIDAARAVGAQKLSYSDQLPPFDLTLVGVTKAGDVARCSIFGLQVTQETAGFSQNDLGNSVGMSFVALAVSPWRSIDQSALDIATNASISSNFG